MTQKESALAGQTALVTGAGGDIGQAMVRSLQGRGAFVVAVDRDSRALRDLAQNRGQAGLLTLEGDVTDEESVRAFTARARIEHGRIDICCNNAGIEGAVLAVPDYPLDVFERVLAINVVGVFLGMKHVIPYMAAQGSGRIINTASIAGLRGGPKLSAYVASKHAVIGLTRSAAAEWGDHGVRVNCIAPGAVNGRMIASIIDGMAPPEDRAALAARTAGAKPSGRYNTPEEVAELTAFLASDEAAAVNGAIYKIDGGQVSEVR
jgi:NAD(P)-dependent dehydrogenase (short-subunit alcohol dehydrogenase family)